ncbi:MAG: DUF3368 domain-containing protein, partial [Bryobacteraceae bacterium]
PWLQVRSPDPSGEDAGVDLDAGEREAIALAEQLSADQLIIDDSMGRREAVRRGLPVIGTVGVLREAAQEGLVDLRACLDRLLRTSFYISPAILDRLLNKEP